MQGRTGHEAITARDHDPWIGVQYRDVHVGTYGMVLGDDSMYAPVHCVYTCTSIYKCSSAWVSSEWGEPGNEARVSCITRYIHMWQSRVEH